MYHSVLSKTPTVIATSLLIRDMQQTPQKPWLLTLLHQEAKVGLPYHTSQHLAATNRLIITGITYQYPATLSIWLL